MKRIFFALCLLIPSITLASSGGVELMKANVNMNDVGSLQNGAKLYMNYCVGCHSLQYVRYSRIGKDLGIPEDVLKQNLMFNPKSKVGDTITTAMKAEDAETWFGVLPPDLSVTARARGADWLYTYFMTFYLDDSRPFGVNNLVFKDVGMPHVLADLQGGYQKLTHVDDGHGHQTNKLELMPNQEMSAEEAKAQAAAYHRSVRDLVSFLVYVGEPAQLQRYPLGWKVLLFLLFFTIVAYLLKKEYWRDVH